MDFFPELFQNTRDIDQNFAQPSIQPFTLPFCAISGQSCGWTAEGLSKDTTRERLWSKDIFPATNVASKTRQSTLTFQKQEDLLCQETEVSLGRCTGACGKLSPAL